MSEVRNDNANSATAGGSFALTNGVTLTANVFAGGVTCVTFSQVTPNAANIVGNVTGGTSLNTAHGVNNIGSGSLSITGNVTGGSTTNSTGASNNTGSLSITGNVTGGSGIGCLGVNNGTGSVLITGNVTGGSAAFGAQQASTGTMTVIGTIEASEFNEGVGGTNRGQITLLTGPFISSATFGVSPIACKAWRWAASLNDQTYITVPTSDLLATRNLVTPDNATNFPSASDVRIGTTYGIGGELSGTCIIPNPSSVASGVGVDNTIGTLTTPTANEIRDAVWSAATSSLTTSGSIGERLKNAATVSTTGEQLAVALTAP